MILIRSLLRGCVWVLALTWTPLAMAEEGAVQRIVDESMELVEAAVAQAQLVPVAQIDHARLAAAEGVEMPPSRVQIYSDPSVNNAILAENIRAGLDLPFRVLAYAEEEQARVAYTSSDFLRIRHGLSDEGALRAFDDATGQVIGAVGANTTPAPTGTLSLDYGVIELKSDLDVESAVASLTETVMAQDDTVWFGDINFTEEARKAGVEVPEARLLLFGGPGPGGIAMAEFPAIGLDAFCQKFLVYAAPDGGTVVLFNDIAAFAELHYGRSAPPHRALNERLTATFQKAIE